ncbi:glycosyltransferase family 2 protein [Halocalculus aciditolerans]|uniref:Glycosyltransferase 2-like domain-containing protein n=1 Tax=Halocalculus aciditolerans TaxID=1383812 RepID=A0A830F2F5_9EURY|nr:glycosyltransferase [Halocalculus aciditolerans]GGL55955.1 hypothetical protein GCM10009039_12680 [Halocalculus aciditolerans]
MSPAISVVVCTVADPDDTGCLRALDAQDFDDYEVVVRDDPGLAAARNAGVEEARADNVVFLDDDATPRDGYLAAAADALAANPVVAGRIHHPGGGPVSRLVGGYDKGPERHYVTPVDGSFRHGRTGVTGCNMAFRKSVFERVGGFDPRFAWGHEETDFVRRAVRAGFRVLYEPDMAVDHWYATSVRDYWRKMWAFGPGDVAFDRKWETPLRERLLSFLLPVRLGPTPTAGVVATVGNLVRNASYLRALLSPRQ